MAVVTLLVAAALTASHRVEAPARPMQAEVMAEREPLPVRHRERKTVKHPAKVRAASAQRASWLTWTASWYGEESGAVTASGEPFRPDALTAAHRSLPFGTRLQVCYCGRCVVVRVNDRGPYVWGRDLDLSRGAAEALGMIGVGVADVQVRIVGEE